MVLCSAPHPSQSVCRRAVFLHDLGCDLHQPTDYEFPPSRRIPVVHPKRRELKEGNSNTLFLELKSGPFRSPPWRVHFPGHGSRSHGLIGSMQSASCIWRAQSGVRTRQRSPEVRSTAFPAHLPDFASPVLDDLGLCSHLPAPGRVGLTSGSCPSGRGFAPRFLQNPPDDALAPG
jgi:hypothetical protein